ncbi:PREDICTED: PR domain zinc finger protein 4 [Dipodomys ordii]|uniref:PR domain zinc finger protein 4 n=1 Tax=Dipodomys ordii TaxID=10020 RepID=A0A1S3FW67_DIPOR|nr:PREDICTED: PR domain zinc finger protein 4 [Dipodomys ordii]
MHHRMNEMNLSPVGMEQLTSSSVSNALPVSGSHLGLAASPTHSAIPAPGILSYLADRPPPQYIHPNSINVDGNTALSIANNPSALDPYQSNGNVGLEPGIVSIDSRSVNTHGAQSLHPSDGHEVALDTTITMENVSRVTSPISTDGMAEELTIDGVAGEHSQIPNGSRSHEPLSVDSVSNNLTADPVGHGGVLPIHGNGLELPVVMETDHIASRVSGMSDSALSDSIHTVAMSTNSVSVALSTSHNLASLESVSLHEVGLSLEPVAVSSITQEVAMGTGHVDVSSDSLSFVPSSLQMEDSNSNKENMATLFTIWCTLCDRAYPSDCPEHGPVTFVPDTPIESRARLSLPKQLVLRQSIVGAEVGNICVVWWNREEQNLVAYPHDGKIYFCTSQDIPPENELLFYYSRDYAQQMGVPEHPDVHLCNCGKECSSYSEFKAHLTSHIHNHLPGQGHSNSHGPGHSKERKWKCSMCPQAFISPSKLHVHIMGHMGMKPHKCDFCSKAFSDPSNLRTHLKIHTGQKNYRCSLCDKSFTQKAHLESHMVIHTGEKNLKCDYCDKLFMRRQDLKQHVLIHTQERQIKCPKCDKLFLRTNHLKKHLNSHEGKRDYVCEKCTKAYLTKYHLTRHLKTCKGPTSSSSAQDEDDDDSEEEDLADAVGSEDCRISSALYSAEESLAAHK